MNNELIGFLWILAFMLSIFLILYILMELHFRRQKDKTYKYALAEMDRITELYKNE